MANSGSKEVIRLQSGGDPWTGWGGLKQDFVDFPGFWCNPDDPWWFCNLVAIPIDRTGIQDCVRVG